MAGASQPVPAVLLSTEVARINRSRQAVAQGLTWLTSTVVAQGQMAPSTTDRSCMRLVVRSVCTLGHSAPITTKEVVALQAKIATSTQSQIGTLKEERFISTIQARVADISRLFVDVQPNVVSSVHAWRTAVEASTASAAQAWQWKLALDMASLHVWDVSASEYVGPLLPHLQTAMTSVAWPTIPVRAQMKSLAGAGAGLAAELAAATGTTQSKARDPLYMPEESESNELLKTSFSVSTEDEAGGGQGKPIGALSVTNMAVRPVHIIGIRVYEEGEEDQALWITMDLVVRPTPTEHAIAQTVQMLATLPLYDPLPSPAPAAGPALALATRTDEKGNDAGAGTERTSVAGKKRARDEPVVNGPSKWLLGVLGRSAPAVAPVPRMTKRAQIIFRFL